MGSHDTPSLQTISIVIPVYQGELTLEPLLAEIEPLIAPQSTPRGVEFYRGWDSDLETFVEGNYLACAPEIATRLPSVAWWKSRYERCSP